jgi:hypothetical protein
MGYALLGTLETLPYNGFRVRQRCADSWQIFGNCLEISYENLATDIANRLASGPFAHPF